MTNPYFSGNLMQPMQDDSLETSAESRGIDPKKLLAESFCEQAQLCLLKGEYEQGKELFERALHNDPDNCKFYLAKGLSFFEYGSSNNYLEALRVATQSFKRAVQLKSDYFEAWLAWSCTLYDLGEKTKEFHYFLQAKNKIAEACKYLSEQPTDALGDLYFHEAIILYAIAEHSQEALDYQLTIDAFEKALSYKNQFSQDFWKAYGFACLSFGEKICDLRIYLKAISCFKQALITHDYTSWVRLAQAILKLYHQTHDEDHFHQAAETFNVASQIKADAGEVWLYWADALLSSGRKNQDMKKIKLSIEKCHRAIVYMDNIEEASCILAEALACMGEFTDRLDLIYEANNKISTVLEQNPSHVRAKLSYYYCLTAFGRYFQDYDYFYQAIEKLQEELSFDRTLHFYWYLMGNTYTQIADIDGDIGNLDKAIKFYEKAIELQLDTNYIYNYAMALSKLGELNQEQPQLEHAVQEFERAITFQKNALYTHPSWLFNWARTLDILGSFHEEEYYYTRALEIYAHVLMMDPDFTHLHHYIALCRSHLGELNGDVEQFFKAIHHFRLAHKYDEDNDQIILDWGITLANLSQHVHSPQESELLLRDAENKIMQATKLGNMQGHYYLGCVNALLKNNQQAFYFLEKAEKFNTLPILEDLLNDDWLDNIRDTEEFQQLLLRVENKHNFQEEC